MSKLEGITSFLQLSDSVATAGQPSPDEFATIKAAGYDVVINLAMPTSTNYLSNERELVEAKGMRYIAIPVDWEKPTSADIERFFTVMDENRGHMLFVHCALNMRVSVFMFLYRVLRIGLTREQAERDLYRIWTPNETWQHFIDSTLQVR